MYCIENPLGYAKIGWTSSCPFRRFEVIQRGWDTEWPEGWPVRLALIATVQKTNLEEKSFHAEFKSLRQSGYEWYRIDSPAVLSFLSLPGITRLSFKSIQTQFHCANRLLANRTPRSRKEMARHQ